MAVNNARTIRATNPGLTLTLVTNMPPTWDFLAAEFDRVVHEDAPDEANRLAKIGCPSTTTAERVLYLDADAEVLGDLTPAFAMLDDFDVLLRPFEMPSKFPHRLGPGLDGQLFPQFMGGILFFRRSPAALDLFRRWGSRYASAGLARDQPALARAVHDTPGLRLLPMNAVWGAFATPGNGYPDGRVAPRIHHYADVSNDPEVLARCIGVLEDIVGRLPAADAPQVAGTVRRLRRLASPLYRSRITNRAARAWWRARDRRAGLDGVDTRKKQPRTAGAALGDPQAPLWDDAA